MTGLQQAALIETAREYREAGRLEEAVGLLTLVLRTSPKNARAQHQLGLTMISGGRADGVKLLESAVDLEPTNADWAADLGEARLLHTDTVKGHAALAASAVLAPSREDLLVRLARGLGRTGRLDMAEPWFARARCLKRPFAEALVAHGMVLHGARRIADAVQKFYAAVIEDQSYTEGFAALAGALQEAGAPREQVMKPARIAAERMRDNAQVVIPVVQYLRDIGEEEEAVRLGTELIDKEMARAAADEFGQHGIRILMPDDMVTRIGEFAFQLDLHVKMTQLGWLPPFVSILVAPKQLVCNRTFLDCWRPYLTVVDDPKLIEYVEPLKHRVPFNPVYVRLPNGRVISKNRAFFMVQEEWQRQGRGPLLDLGARQAERGRAELSRMGVPDGAWFVCVHVRETGFLGDAKGPEAARNANIRDYFPAIEEIRRRGGWVVRLGDKSMTPLPSMPQVVDYACSPFKSEEMDVFLAARCRFFLGTTSGMCVVASVFGTPVGGANFFPMGERLHTSRDVIIPKLYRERASGRTLSFEECLAMPLALTYDAEHFDKLGLEALDSGPDDVHDLAVEMLERAEGQRLYSEDDESLQRRWDDLCRPYSTGDVGCRIGRGFLRRHRRLFAKA